MGKKKKKKKFKFRKIKDNDYLNGNKVWDSGYKPLKPTVVIHSKLIRLTKYIQNKVDDNEFSILAKGHFENGKFYVDFDYYIPQQEVTGTSVDYKENIGAKKEEGYNTVIHSHPFLNSNSGNFSGADDEHINSHFTCSILVNGSGEPVKAVLNIPFQNTTIQVEAEEILELIEDFEIDEKEITEKIKTQQYQSYYQTKTIKDDDDDEEEKELEKKFRSRWNWKNYDYYNYAEYY